MAKYTNSHDYVNAVVDDILACFGETALAQILRDEPERKTTKAQQKAATLARKHERNLKAQLSLCETIADNEYYADAADREIVNALEALWALSTLPTPNGERSVILEKRGYFMHWIEIYPNQSLDFASRLDLYTQYRDLVKTIGEMHYSWDSENDINFAMCIDGEAYKYACNLREQYNLSSAI